MVSSKKTVSISDTSLTESVSSSGASGQFFSFEKTKRFKSGKFPTRKSEDTSKSNIRKSKMSIEETVSISD